MLKNLVKRCFLGISIILLPAAIHASELTLQPGESTEIENTRVSRVSSEETKGPKIKVECESRDSRPDVIVGRWLVDDGRVGKAYILFAPIGGCKSERLVKTCRSTKGTFIYICGYRYTYRDSHSGEYLSDKPNPDYSGIRLYSSVVKSNLAGLPGYEWNSVESFATEEQCLSRVNTLVNDLCE